MNQTINPNELKTARGWLNQSNPTIAASILYNVIWATFGSHLYDRIVKW